MTLNKIKDLVKKVKEHQIEETVAANKKHLAIMEILCGLTEHEVPLMWKGDLLRAWLKADRILGREQTCFLYQAMHSCTRLEANEALDSLKG